MIVKIKMITVKKVFLLLVTGSIMFAFSYNYFSLGWAGQPLFLIDKHKKAGVACKDCHKESSSQKQVPMAVCYQCHGEQIKLAERTQKVIPNPHNSHIDALMGDLKCELCHHVHKPSEDYCGKCHDYGFMVP